MQRRWMLTAATAATALIVVGTARAERATYEKPVSLSRWLVLERPVIKGSMPRSYLLRGLAPHGRAIEQCLDHEKSPLVILTVRMVVGSDGRVPHAEVVEWNVMRDTEECLVRVLEAVDFGQHPPGIDIVYQRLTYDSPAYR